MVKSLSNSTHERKQLIMQLIKDGKIHSQADVVRELAMKGMVVTQATASRDLQELGAMRSKNQNGESRYILGEAEKSRPDGNLVLSVVSSGNTVVLRTPPAAAQFIASTLDEAIINKELMTAIGTVAGDDTVLVIAASADGGSNLAKEISIMFGKEE